MVSCIQGTQNIFNDSTSSNLSNFWLVYNQTIYMSLEKVSLADINCTTNSESDVSCCYHNNCTSVHCPGAYPSAEDTKLMSNLILQSHSDAARPKCTGYSLLLLLLAPLVLAA
ncbi:hypothetical protein EC988_000837 [Linderina pennispora]|nr:hypothetical protein EC988_000837 [Linderina pennispora]